MEDLAVTALGESSLGGADHLEKRYARGQLGLDPAIRTNLFAMDQDRLIVSRGTATLGSHVEFERQALPDGRGGGDVEVYRSVEVNILDNEAEGAVQSRGLFCRLRNIVRQRIGREVPDNRGQLTNDDRRGVQQGRVAVESGTFKERPHRGFRIRIVGRGTLHDVEVELGGTRCRQSFHADAGDRGGADKQAAVG